MRKPRAHCGWKPGAERTPCEECGKVFTQPPYPSWRRRFCSVKCGRVASGRTYRKNLVIIDNAVPAPPSECWLWEHGCDNRGYGRLCHEGKKRLAHAVSWEQANKAKIPNGMIVMHKCDVTSCVNPRHLRLGTRTDNHADMVAKGRNGWAEEKLPVEAVREIKALAGSPRGWISRTAKKFNVSHSLVSMIAAGKRRRNACQAN